MIGAWPLLAPLPSLGGHAVFLLLVQIALLLLAARIGGELCRRVALPAVVGELAAGILLGPSVLGHYFPGVSAAIFPLIQRSSTCSRRSAPSAWCCCCC